MLWSEAPIGPSGVTTSGSSSRARPVLPTTARPVLSVGIDVGSATSQVLISRLWLVQATASLVSARVEVRHRQIVHASQVWLTPYREGGPGGGPQIDAPALRVMVESAYAQAGLEPAEVETGALIVTGEAARTDNANSVACLLAGLAGRFVCVSAGPHLEARLASYGSNAVARSAGDARTALHVDIGGGTTKLAVIRDGEILETAATNVGARMLTFAPASGLIDWVSPALARLAEDLDAHVSVGTVATAALRRQLAEAMAAELVRFIAGVAGSLDAVADEAITAPLRETGPFELLSYSGGVAAYIYGEQTVGFGDLGTDLGAAIPAALACLDAERIELRQAIRATVLGASQFGTQVSGMTTHVSGGASGVPLLPRRALRVVPARIGDGQLDRDGVAQEIRRCFAAVDLRPGAPGVALALHWSGDPSLARLSAVAGGIVDATRSRPASGQPGPGLTVILDRDLGGALGQLLQRERPDDGLVVVDEISLGEFDVIDIGEPMSDPPVLPVVIQSVIVGPASATVFSTQDDG